jgi:hypothetical protein
MATTVTLKPNAIDISGSTSGTTTLQATAVAGTTTITLPAATDTLVGKATTDTLTNKTLTTPVISTISNTGTLTLPTSTDTLVGRATTDTLTNKTLTTPVISLLSSASATALTLQSAGTTAITVDTSQNVGIGTTSPANKLDVAGIITASGSPSNPTGTTVSFYNGSGVGSTISGYQFAVRTGGTPTEAMRIDSSGNVGIGTTSISNKLEVNGTINIVNGSSVGWGNQQTTITGSTATNIMQFSTAAAERMRIDGSGNLLLGVTSLSTAERFNCTKSAAGNKIAHFENTGNTNGDELLRTKLGSNANNTTSYHLVCSTVNDKLYIFGNGNVVNVNNSYGTLSDIKLKENVVDATPKLADVMQLKVRNFNLKTDPEHKQIGFIAQELEQVFPALIDETHDRAEDGSQLETTVKSIKTSVLLPILVKAIQELKAINDTQAETINALTARIVALESK